MKPQIINPTQWHLMILWRNSWCQTSQWKMPIFLLTSPSFDWQLVLSVASFLEQHLTSLYWIHYRSGHQYWLCGKTACRNHWPWHTPELCEHSGNRCGNQEQKAFSRAIAFVPQEKLKESLKEHQFPKVYASLVSSLRSNEKWRLLLYLCIPWLAEYFSLKKAVEGGWKFSFIVFRSVFKPLFFRSLVPFFENII